MGKTYVIIIALSYVDTTDTRLYMKGSANDLDTLNTLFTLYTKDPVLYLVTDILNRDVDVRKPQVPNVTRTIIYPTLKNVKQMFDTLHSVLNPDDFLFVTYSGHGTSLNNLKSTHHYTHLYNSRYSNRTSYFNLVSTFMSLKVHRVLLLDSCSTKSVTFKKVCDPRYSIITGSTSIDSALDFVEGGYITTLLVTELVLNINLTFCDLLNANKYPDLVKLKCIQSPVVSEIVSSQQVSGVSSMYLTDTILPQNILQIYKSV